MDVLNFVFSNVMELLKMLVGPSFLKSLLPLRDIFSSWRVITVPRANTVAGYLKALIRVHVTFMS